MIDREAALLDLVLSLGADNPAHAGSYVGKALDLLQSLGIEPRDGFFHTPEASLEDAKERLKPVPHVIRFEHNWGTRWPRHAQHIYVSRKPSPGEIIALLREKLGLANATLEWLEPRNSGLISVYPLVIEELSK